jgi:hypothetical protein
LSLEFNKVVDQVYKLGRMLDEIDLNASNRLDLAIERFYEATDLDFIHERVEMTRRPDVSGYRGAAPLDAPIHEVVCQTFPCPTFPASATIIAADGSQIYPAEQSPVHYFLVNIGLFTYHHGADRVPDQYSVPRLFFHKDHVHDPSGRILSNRTIDARRTATEMHELGAKCWELRDEARPLIALYDNHLLFWANEDVTGARQLMQQYHGALLHLHDSGAILAGYVDNPTRSRVMIRLLHLLSLTDEEVRSSDLSSSRELEGVTDVHLFSAVLQAGERSAIMVQNSPRNLKYRQRGDSYEIAFFYLKVSSGYQDAIARVDIPMWVARDRALVDELHAVLVSQCSLQGRNPYPYSLTRADELAYVSGKDKSKLDEMIAIELRKKGLNPHPFSGKAWGKLLARSNKRQHEM